MDYVKGRRLTDEEWEHMQYLEQLQAEIKLEKYLKELDKIVGELINFVGK